METLLILTNPLKWNFILPGVTIISSREYLTNNQWAEKRKLKIFNLSKSYKYQSEGYYVSLLALARGHRVAPSINTLNEMKNPSVIKIFSEELEDLIQKSLSDHHSDKFNLNIYFGKNPATKYEKLARELSKLFQTPFLCARFTKNKKWSLQSISPIPTSEIPEEHREFIVNAAEGFFHFTQQSKKEKERIPFNLAILIAKNDATPPSDDAALKKFSRTAESRGFRTTFITKDDYDLIPRFDALFIRETTAVNHHTYRFAVRAKAEGLIVIDDPDSIVKCTNKVYLAELLTRHKIPTPGTYILHKENRDEIGKKINFPVVLKQPDSAFSLGVKKASSLDEFKALTTQLLETSELVIIQEFLPTEFDWRVGLLNGEILYISRYYMAKKHWQIVKYENEGKVTPGKSDCIDPALAPPGLSDLAIKTAKLVGKGLYGVDIKESKGKFFVIEINDNPSIDRGVEDEFAGNTLYEKIMDYFLKQLREGDEKK